MVKVQILRGHDTVYWIPDYYWDRLHIIPDDSDALDFERIPERPLVVISHGIGNMTAYNSYKGSIYSELYADYYLATTKQEHEGLLSYNKKSFYTGGAFSDFTLPTKREPDLLVYVPDHGIPDSNCSGGYYHSKKPLTKQQLLYYVTKYKCKGYVTSVLDEDRRIGLYSNIALSDRNKPLEHQAKCRMLYEKAKVVIEDSPGTFGIVANSNGIEVEPRPTLETPTDGKCRERIIKALDDIIKDIQ